MIADRSTEPFGAGPYTWAQERLHLGRPGDSAVRRRMIAAAAVSLAPLVMLSAAQGVLIGPTPAESLLYDIGSITRYLIGMPILLVAEWSYLPRLSQIIRYLPDSGIIDSSEQARYAMLVASVRRLMTSRVIGVILLILAYVATVVIGPRYYAPTESTWVAPITASGHHISAAGWWRTLVSQPLFLLIVGTLVWRLTLWTYFLWKVSRFNLRLLPSHPDRRGGLGFIPATVRAFPPLAFAIGAIIAGNVATWVAFEGHPKAEVKYAMAAAVIIVVVMLVGPLMVFGPVLYRLRTEGVYKYGRLMHDVGSNFESKWLPPARPTENPVGSADFSSMIDLSSVVANVESITPIMVDLHSLTPLVFAALVPFIPVLFLVLPAQEIFDAVAKFLF